VPRREQHVRVGAVTGAAAAALAAGASGQGPVAIAIEAAGGGLGGGLGARMPDVVNPPTSPFHRAFAHSACAGSCVVNASAAVILNWQASCRERAAACHEAWNRPDATLLDTVFAAFGELFWRLLSGLLAGFPVGYASHLAMDSLTRAGIRFA
jgi:hypothetical protein